MFFGFSRLSLSLSSTTTSRRTHYSHRPAWHQAQPARWRAGRPGGRPRRARRNRSPTVSPTLQTTGGGGRPRRRRRAAWWGTRPRTWFLVLGFEGRGVQKKGGSTKGGLGNAHGRNTTEDSRLSLLPGFNSAKQHTHTTPHTHASCGLLRRGGCRLEGGKGRVVFRAEREGKKQRVNAPAQPQLPPPGQLASAPDSTPPAHGLGAQLCSGQHAAGVRGRRGRGCSAPARRHRAAARQTWPPTRPPALHLVGLGRTPVTCAGCHTTPRAQKGGHQARQRAGGRAPAPERRLACLRNGDPNTNTQTTHRSERRAAKRGGGSPGTQVSNELGTGGRGGHERPEAEGGVWERERGPRGERRIGGHAAGKEHTARARIGALTAGGRASSG